MTPLAVKHPTAFHEAEAGSQAAITMDAKIPGDLLAVAKQGGRVRMHFLVVTVVSNGCRAGKTGAKMGKKTQKAVLKGSP